MARRPRDYRAEEARRNELARERGFPNRSWERYAKERHGPVAEAERWVSYKAAFPTKRSRTVTNARLFLSAFGSMGATGIPNRHRGFVADNQQRADRRTFENAGYIQNASIIAFGERYELGSDAWWELWREQYADTFL